MLFCHSSKTHLSVRFPANESASLQNVQIGRCAFFWLLILVSV